MAATMAVGIGAGMAVAGMLSYLLGEDERWSGWWRIAWLPPQSPLWRSGECPIGSVDDQLPSAPVGPL